MLAGIALANPTVERQPIVVSPILSCEERPAFMDGNPKEHLMDALLYYEIEHPEIVYAQAILETGHFSSKGCTHKNNLFGLMKGRSLRSFDHWTESVIFYKERIQNRYKGGDYYSFLKRIKYAEDRRYNERIRKIVRQNKSGRKDSVNGAAKDDTKRVSASGTSKKKSGTKKKRSRRISRKARR